MNLKEWNKKKGPILSFLILSDFKKFRGRGRGNGKIVAQMVNFLPFLFLNSLSFRQPILLYLKSFKDDFVNSRPCFGKLINEIFNIYS